VKINFKIPPKLVRPALIASIAGFALYFIAAAFAFAGFVNVFAGLIVLLFGLVFPLYFGAVALGAGRAGTSQVMDFRNPLFTGLPRWFDVTYQLYFYSVGLVFLTVFVLEFTEHKGGIGLGFVLIPSAFYLACIGAYWSELRLQSNEAALPNEVPPVLVGAPPTLSVQLRSWSRFWPVWMFTLLAPIAGIPLLCGELYSTLGWRPWIALTSWLCFVILLSIFAQIRFQGLVRHRKFTLAGLFAMLLLPGIVFSIVGIIVGACLLLLLRWIL